MDYNFINLTSSVTPNGLKPGVNRIHYDLWVMGFESNRAIKKNGVLSKGPLFIGAWNNIKSTQHHATRAKRLFSYFPQAQPYGATNLYIPAFSNLLISTHPGFMTGFSKQEDASRVAQEYLEQFHELRSGKIPEANYTQVLINFLGEEKTYHEYRKQVEEQLATFQRKQQL